MCDGRTYPLIEMRGYIKEARYASYDIYIEGKITIKKIDGPTEQPTDGQTQLKKCEDSS